MLGTSFLVWPIIIAHLYIHTEHNNVTKLRLIESYNSFYSHGDLQGIPMTHTDSILFEKLERHQDLIILAFRD